MFPLMREFAGHNRLLVLITGVLLLIGGVCESRAALLVDGPQSLQPEDFSQLMEDLKPFARAAGRQM